MRRLAILTPAGLMFLAACTTQVTNIAEITTPMPVEMPTMSTSSPTTPETSEMRPKAPGGMVVTDILSARSGPGYRYSKVDELPKGATFDIIAKWCGHSADDDWYLISFQGAAQRWIPGARQYVSTWNADRLVCLVPPPTPTATPVNPNFRADRTTIAPGECTALRWDADQIYAIYLDGESTTRHGTRRVCPPQTRTYTLTVRERDGRRNDHKLTIQVAESPVLAGATPPPAAQTTPSGPAEAAPSHPTMTATPAFPQVVTEPARLTEFKLAMGRYRLAEKETLKSPDSAAVEQLLDFAHGEALASVLDRAGQLRAQGSYAELIVQRMDVQAAVLQDDRTAGVLVQEKHILRIFQPSTDGDHLVEEKVFEGTIVYGLTYLDSRWKVERVRPASNVRQ